MTRVRCHFSKSFDRHESKLIGLYEEVSVWSFPGFGIIMMIDFFHLLGSSPVIALNSWLMVPTAHSGSSISIFRVIRSQPGDFLGCRCSFIIFMTSHGRNTVGSAKGKSSSACVGSVFVASGPAAHTVHSGNFKLDGDSCFI